MSSSKSKIPLSPSACPGPRLHHYAPGRLTFQEVVPAGETNALVD